MFLHKNLKTISTVGNLLERLGFDAIFVVTLAENDYAKMDDCFKKYTINVGSVSVIDCPALYRVCNALYLPTLIECFTVSYLEAMVFNMPIATSDLDFARDLCGDSAFFFDPYDTNSIATILAQLVSTYSLELKSSLAPVYKNNMARFGDNEDRVDKYVSIINKIYNIQKTKY